MYIKLTIEWAILGYILGTLPIVDRLGMDYIPRNLKKKNC